MAYEFDVLIKNGLVVDPNTNIHDIKDIGIKDGKIAKIEDSISATKAEEIFDVNGKLVVPGLVDLHMHASTWLGGKYGHKMLAQAGVTSALDMSGPIEGVMEIAKDNDVGLNIACIEYVRPEHTVKTNNPSDKEIDDVIESCFNRGAIGIKLLGGHYPLTSDATKRAIQIANDKHAYVAFHAGTMTYGSNIQGALEAIELADGNAIHLAHINSYCRGNVRDYMLETEEIIEALKKNPRIRTEAYLSPLNGTSAKCSNGIPESLVTHKCLQMGGFEATEEGLEKAIANGWAQINVETGGKVDLGVGQEAVEYWRSKGTDTTVSFAVNPAEPRYRLATVKRDNGEFVVDCISTDGGGIPRNVTIEMGLSLVKLNALSLEDFVLKSSTNPARILGLKNKGHFNIGADADITIINMKEQKPYMSLSNGKVVMIDGYVCGSGSKIITTAKGEEAVKNYGLEPLVVDLSESGFYKW